jgi:hypothetical protein
VTDSDDTPPLATLWQLSWKQDRLSCSVYRDGEGLQLRLESDSTVILAEPFDLMPRTLARTQALRESLKRRGWHEPPAE